jgi:predicted metalloprotease with PDZ domain
VKWSLVAVTACVAAAALWAPAATLGNSPAVTLGDVPAPQDRPYPGELRLLVDATDLERRIVRVHETLTGASSDTVLLYPQWLPGNHAPSGQIERLAGLTIEADGARIAWRRDPLNVYAFHVQVPAGVRVIDLDFQYLAATSPKVGRPEISRDILILDWNAVVLYPAGYDARQIPLQAKLTLPTDWNLATALEPASSSGPETRFKRTNLGTLVDSPVYAGRHMARLDLDPGSAVPVHLNLFADRPEFLTVKPEQLAAHRALVQQAYKLFGSHHYAHYDFLYSLSEEVLQKGLEHHESSENGANPDVFTDWDRTAYARDLLSHEYTHSWNGKFRRPSDLWTPNYNVPMQGSLLWVYEGQTQYWGQVLSARSGLRTKQQALDQLALTAAFYDKQTGKQWRPLQDTTNDEIINPRRPMPWRDWQRFEDYYSEGLLIWLDADTLIRERSKGKRSLDDFARAFFGINDGSVAPVTYTFEDVVAALNAVEPYDWTAFLRQRLDAVATPAPLDGLLRGGYRLVYTETPSDYERTADEQRKHFNLMFSIGLEVDSKDNSIAGIMWDGPAFRANLTEGDVILAVNGNAYSGDELREAVKNAKNSQEPIELIVKSGDRFFVAHLDYHEGLRYPHLERDASLPPRLDDILAARK